MGNKVDDITKQRKAKNEAKEASTKKARLPHSQITTHLVNLLNGQVDGENAAPADLGTFPYPLMVVRSKEDDAPGIFMVCSETRTVVATSLDQIEVDLYAHLAEARTLCDPEYWHWDVSVKQVKEVVKIWSRHPSTPRHKMPRSIGFKSDPDLVFYRLAFDPYLGADEFKSLIFLAPTWHEILTRMNNAEGFCARVGSIFDPEADRKQAVWISGPGDSGKSQIVKQLKKLVGEAFVTMSESDFKNEMTIKSELVGKRVAAFSEVSAAFINTEQFKSITGDEEHRIRTLYQKGYTGRLDTLLFFFSNNPPRIQSKPELLNRIIYCGLAGLPAGTEKIGECEYQKMLDAEIENFIGYCVNVYNRNKGRRIPNSTEFLDEVVEERDEEIAMWFENRFAPDKNSRVSSRELTAELNQIRDYKQRTQYRDWVRRHHMTDECRVRERTTKRDVVWFVGWKNLGYPGDGWPKG